MIGVGKMADKNMLLKARTDLIDEMEKELLGPGSEYSIPDDQHEIITDLPEIRYSAGILFPQNNKIKADNNEIPTETNGEEEDFQDDNEFMQELDPSNEDKIKYSGSVAEDTDTNTLDEEVSLSTQNMPSSMGFTFLSEKSNGKYRFEISFGKYRKSKLEDCKVLFSPENKYDYKLPKCVEHLADYSRETGLLQLNSRLVPKDVRLLSENEDMTTDLRDHLYKLSYQFVKGFVRSPHGGTIDVDICDSKNYFEVENIFGCSLKLVILKKKYKDGIYAFTVLLVNTETGSYNGENSIFQPKLTISSKDNDSLYFEEYTNHLYSKNNDLEELSLELLYRDKKTYATGHGVSMNWNIDNSGSGSIWSEYIPHIVVPQVDFELIEDKFDEKALSMKYLSDLNNTDRIGKIRSLQSLVDIYADWISKVREKGLKLERRYRDTVERHMNECNESCQRMYYGISLLETNDLAYDTFQLANRSMFMQRIHGFIQQKDRYPNDLDLQEQMREINYYDCSDEDCKWRPFQLAFLLMSLRSVVEPDSIERDLVDLIWFPTGGGKTEAYLGLTAYTIFFRRLAHLKESSGTTVIMRYTLRLLAAQQFLRASTLICACEAIRKDCGEKSKYPSYQLGKEKITIGLWIGGTHTPNKNDGRDSAKEHLNNLLKAKSINLKEFKEKHNKFQLLKCPWCGTKLVKDYDETGKRMIGEWGYRLENGKRFRLHCTQEDCEFEKDLPIQIVDEELYDQPPTLLFGTVDKFAMLPWKNDIGSFFATSNNNRTPELIIQDELHLISGPLGTMVGLYETIIDSLCSAKGVNPKIIASTATIRRAKGQCSNLYNREVRQFPSQGIDASDSFFAREAKLHDKPGRLYVGLMPSGKTKAMMEVRSIATLLQRVHMMNIPYDVKDKFWTLAVYFNSLRDLSKCSTLVDDDVKDFIRRMAYRFGRRNIARPTGSADELTSRISTSQLNETLEKLELLVYSEANQAAKKYPVNVLLATNMISVGVDVSRLNVMLLVGQPKLTSEYIQASSRIGRRYPGVAFVLYDGAKSRDRSHYEQFKAYHESFYRFVEPTGATPFAKPARDRALHAVLISLLRHKYGLSSDGSASLFDKGMQELKEIEDYIIKRLSDINNRSNIQLVDDNDEIIKEIADFWEDWHERIEISDKEHFYYGDRYIVSDPPSDNKRLIKTYGGESTDIARETLTSMRNVDKSVTAGIIIWE